MNAQEVALIALLEFLESEAGEYSYLSDSITKNVYELDPDTILVDVDFIEYETTVHFRISNVLQGNPEEVKLEVCMYEDIWEETRTYDWRVKYFWIALLWKTQ